MKIISRLGEEFTAIQAKECGQNGERLKETFYEYNITFIVAIKLNFWDFFFLIGKKKYIQKTTRCKITPV